MWKGVEEGVRNLVAFTLTRRLRCIGLDEQLCMPVFQEWNKRNKPPLLERELIATVRSACRKKYSNIGCKQIRLNSELSRFCDEDNCRRIRKDEVRHSVNMSAPDVSAPTDRRISDKELYSKHYAFILEALGDVDSKIQEILSLRDKASIEHIEQIIDTLEFIDFLTEEDLRLWCEVYSIRSPCNQRILFCSAFFVGRFCIHYGDCDWWPKLVWYVRVLRADGAEPMPPCACLMTITEERFKRAGLNDPESAFPGLCLLIAKDDYEIDGYATNLEGILNGTLQS